MGRKLRVLIVDDNRSAADALARVLRKEGDEVDPVYDGESAIARIREAPPDLVLTDLKMEPVDGLAVLEAARDMRPPVEVIVFTAYGAVDVAVRAMRMGARDFLTKPVTVEQVSSRLDALRGFSRAATGLGGHDELDFVAASPRSQELLASLRQAAGVPSSVWIEGEVGAGRGHAALTLHGMGPDPSAPFVVRDLHRDAPWPERGTVLLPNVDDLPDDLQRALHRALDLLPPGVRVIATSNPDARRAIAEGRLRAELYYALAVIVVSVPPLRVRPEDILPLIDKALDAYAHRYNRPRPELDPEVGKRLAQHDWPGNVRELLNLAERAVVMGPSALGLDTSPAGTAELPEFEPGFSLADYLEDVERRLLVEALRRAGGDRGTAGRLLGVERNTLRYKLNKYGLLDKA